MPDKEKNEAAPAAANKFVQRPKKVRKSPDKKIKNIDDL